MAWMLRLECCPLVRNHSRFQVALWWIGFINPIKNWMGPNPKENPGPSFESHGAKKILRFFSGVIFGWSSRSDFLEFSANFDVEDWKMTLEDWGWDIRIFGIKLGTFQNEVSKLANCSIVIVPFPYFPPFLITTSLAASCFSQHRRWIHAFTGYSPARTTLNRHKRGGRNDVVYQCCTGHWLNFSDFWNFHWVFFLLYRWSLSFVSSLSRFLRPMPMHQINTNWQASSQVLNPRHQHPPQCWEGPRNLHPVNLSWNCGECCHLHCCSRFVASQFHSQQATITMLSMHISVCIGYDVEPSWRFPLIAIWEFM